MQEDFSQHTPMMQQYLEVKAKYKDYILFYRMGDFYEVFFDDAIKVSQLLNLTLTKRGRTQVTDIPMAGVPHHAAENYLARLVKLGEQIAICEQIGEAGKGIIKREVNRVITSGTLTDDIFLDAKQDNYLVAITQNKAGFGMARCVVSSGKLEVLQIPSLHELENELDKINLAELLLDDGINWQQSISQIPCIRYFPSWHFDADSSRQVLLKHFNVADLSHFGCDNLPTALNAAGAIIYYAQSTQQNLTQITQISKIEQKTNFNLDVSSRKHLEIFKSQSGDKRHSLLAIIDKSSSAMGARRLRSWLENPTRDKKIILDRQASAQALVQEEFLSNLEFQLNEIGDLERIITRVILQTVKPIDLLRLKQTLQTLPIIKNNILAQLNAKPILLQNIDKKLLLYTDLLELLQTAINEEPPAIVSAGVIKAGFDNELDKLRSMSEDSSTYLAQLEEKERQATGITGLKLGFNKIHGYYIEISRTNAQENLPDYYTRRQTLKNTERYITPELKKFEEEILSAQSKALEREKAIYKQIVQKISTRGLELKATADALADLDALCSFAFLIKHFNYALPEFSNNTEIVIKNARHPIVEALNAKPFIANSLNLNAKNKMWIITGANMGGKSTYMRQMALIVLLAHIGAPVPAESAIIGDIDVIYTRIGASDDLVNNKSTFMVEMSEAAYILQNATAKSLIIMDEVGRGTSTFDGLSLAYAIAEYLNNLGAFCLFSTHYFELTHISNKSQNVENYHMAAAKQREDLIFLYKIQAGAASQSYGLDVAKIAGVPAKVIQLANKKLRELENSDYADMHPKQGGLFEAQEPRTDLQANEKAKIDEKTEQIKIQLRNLDINSLTPLQSMEILNQLKNLAK